MKYTLLLICTCLVFSCSDSFINHKLKFQKIGDCNEFSQSVKVISNLYGQRYEFYSCMDDGFDGKNYTVDRSGDSVIVNLPNAVSQNRSLYKLILDVDAKPAYQHIILDGREVNFASSEK